MILTNKFTPHYNYENIDKDFDIFMVTKTSDKLERTNILDIPSSEFNARAVQYLWGYSAFVLFDKDSVKESKFRSTLQELYQDVKVKRIDVLDEDERTVFYGQNYLLANLLINTIKSPQFGEFRYNNLTGSLLYHESSWTHKKQYIWFLKIFFERGMHLRLSVKTFKKAYSSHGEKGYIFDSLTGAFRKRLKSDDYSGKVYVEGGNKKIHNTVEYLKFKNIKQFNSSKMGIMEQFLRDANDSLKDYVVFNPVSIDDFNEYKELKLKNNTAQTTEIEKLLCLSGVNIVDCCETEESRYIISQLENEIKNRYGLDTHLGRLDDKKYNIRIIHNKEYYENNIDVSDPHQDDLCGYVVQHITLEDFLDEGEMNQHGFDKIIQELIIKGDIHNKKMTIYNWSKLGFTEVWNFVIREKFYLDDKKHYFVYLVMHVKPDGSIDFDRFNNKDYVITEERELIMSSFDNFQSEAKRTGNEVEGLIYIDINNINAIIRTLEFTRPDTKYLYKALSETEESTVLQKSELVELIKEFSDEYEEYKTYSLQLIEQLESEKSILTKGEFKTLMNVRLKPAKALNRWLYDKHNLWIYSEVKSLKNELYMTNIVNIKYFEKEDEFEKSLNYFVGLKSLLNYKVDKSCIIRKIVAENEIINSKELFSLMAVEFVRNGQYTVLPFPFKYLREYKNIIIK